MRNSLQPGVSSPPGSGFYMMAQTNDIRYCKMEMEPWICVGYAGDIRAICKEYGKYILGVFWGCARGIQVKCGEYAGNVLSMCERYRGDWLGI